MPRPPRNRCRRSGRSRYGRQLYRGDGHAARHHLAGRADQHQRSQPQELARQRIDDVKALAAFTPGMTVADTGPSSTGKIVLRGINSGDSSVDGANANSAVGVYLGEVRSISISSCSTSTTWKCCRVHRARFMAWARWPAPRYMPSGPIPNTIRRSAWPLVRESHSSQAGVNADGTVNIPIVKDHIALRSTVGYFDNPGFMDYNYLLRNRVFPTRSRCAATAPPMPRSVRLNSARRTSIPRRM
jgi:hypothetical protein